MVQQWRQILTSDDITQAALFEYYKTQFPDGFKIIRKHLADFIEDSVLMRLNRVDVKNVEHYAWVYNFIEELKERIQELCKAPNSGAKGINTTYYENMEHSALFGKLKACLEREQEFLKLEEDHILINIDNLSEGSNQNKRHLDFIMAQHTTILEDNKNLQVVEETLQLLKCGQGVVNQTQNDREIEGNLIAQKTALTSRNIENITLTVTALNQFQERLDETVSLLLQICTATIRKLYAWKKEQQKIAYGEVGAIKLNRVQLYFEELCNMVIILKDHIDRTNTILWNYTTLDGSQLNHTLPVLLRKVKEIEELLLKEGLVIEEQPPQMLTQENYFSNSVTVRHLAITLLNNLNPLSVMLSLIKERQLKQASYQKPDTKAMTHEKKCLVLEHQDDGTPMYSATFKKCKLRKAEFQNLQKLDELETNLRVMEGKYHVHVEIEGFAKHRIFATSLPVTVVSGNIQTNIACAVILWDNAFRRTAEYPNDNLVPAMETIEQSYEIPESVPWDSLFPVISKWFGKETGRELNNSHKKVLEKKLFGSNPVGHVSTSMLWRHTIEQKSETKFTFWRWLYEIAKLIKGSLAKAWKLGLIIGFLEKAEAEERLFNCEAGMFLARFSDTVLGALSLPFTEIDLKDFKKIVRHGLPWTSLDFKARSLTDRVISMDQFQKIYTLTDNSDAKIQPKSEISIFRYLSSPPRNDYDGDIGRIGKIDPSSPPVIIREEDVIAILKSWVPFNGATNETTGKLPALAVANVDEGMETETSQPEVVCQLLRQIEILQARVKELEELLLRSGTETRL